MSQCCQFIFLVLNIKMNMEDWQLILEIIFNQINSTLSCVHVDHDNELLKKYRKCFQQYDPNAIVNTLSTELKSSIWLVICYAYILVQF